MQILHLVPETNGLQLHAPESWSQSWSKLPAELQSQEAHLEILDFI